MTVRTKNAKSQKKCAFQKSERKTDARVLVSRGIRMVKLITAMFRILSTPHQQCKC